MNRKYDKFLKPVVGTISVVVMLLAWQIFAQLGLADIRFSSSPQLVWVAARDLMTTFAFWQNAGASISEFAIGMAIACVVGIPLGIALGWFRRFRLAFDPVIMVFYSVPSTTFLPLIILWFGIGVKAYAFLVFFSAFFPISVNSTAGIRQADPSLIRAARSFCATPLDTFRLVLLPSALPFVMSGVRLGLGRGLLGVVFGEMYFSVMGIGHLIMQYQAGLNTDKLMFLVTFTAVFGVILVALARKVEAWVAPWRLAREG